MLLSRFLKYFSSAAERGKFFLSSFLCLSLFLFGLYIFDKTTTTTTKQNIMFVSLNYLQLSDRSNSLAEDKSSIHFSKLWCYSKANTDFEHRMPCKLQGERYKEIGIKLFFHEDNM